MRDIGTKPRGQTVRVEFWIYFALIYALVLPVSILRWAARLVVASGPGETRSAFGDAWARAWAITPQIFSA